MENWLHFFSDTSPRAMWLAYAIAALGFIPAIGFYYVGEEAIFPIGSLEMWYHGDWLRKLLFGADLQQNTLYNWLIIALSSLAGWEYMLVMARIITVASTLVSSILVFMLAKRLFMDGRFAILSAVAYLTLEDVLFYRGWLAYADPLFSMFVLASIVGLWTACLENNRLWLIAANITLACAFLAKTFTAYVFYGVAGLVLLMQHRKFLLTPFSLLLHSLALSFPLVWLTSMPGSQGKSGRMLAEITDKLSLASLADYAAQIVAFPLQTFLRMAPLALIVLYLIIRRRINMTESFPHRFKGLLAIGTINFLPYWLWPISLARYLLPIFPFFAIVLARLAWRGGESAVSLTMRWLWVAIIVKLGLVFFAFPYYQSHYRGEGYKLAAQDIRQRTAGYPVFTTNTSASGLSVAAYLNVLRLPAPPLTLPPEKWDNGFVLSYDPDPKQGLTYRTYALGANTLHLLCRGHACDKPHGNSSN